MGKLQSFTVEFESQYGVCQAGQAVIGAVCIQLSESTKVNGVCLRLLGRAKVHWSFTSGKHTTTYRAEEIYANVEIYVIGSPSGETFRLEGGTHRYPFTLGLPPSVPSSYEGQLGYVRYTAEAKMVRPWKFDHVTRSAFTVISLVDLNLEPAEFRQPCQMTNDAVVSCCCWTSGTVSATLRLNKKCYVPGETIFINADIVNNSETDIVRTRAALKQNVEFIGYCTSLFAQHSVPITRQVSLYVTSCEGEGVIQAGTTGTWNNIPMQVPAVVPSRLAGCNIINCNYVLELCIDAQHTDLKVTVDILIGTVPLRESFRNLPSTQYNAAITNQPPSAPQMNNQQDFGLPPTYEECTMAGAVDIREKDDNEYVRGELRWRPRYPMYRQLSEPQGASAPPLGPAQINIDNM